MLLSLAILPNSRSPIIIILAKGRLVKLFRGHGYQRHVCKDRTCTGLAVIDKLHGDILLLT